MALDFFIPREAMLQYFSAVSRFIFNLFSPSQNVKTFLSTLSHYRPQDIQLRQEDFHLLQYAKLIDFYDYQEILFYHF